MASADNTKLGGLNNKQLLDEVFVICGIVIVEVSVIITLTETLIIPHIAKTEFNNCFIIHFKKKLNVVLLLYHLDSTFVFFFNAFRIP